METGHNALHKMIVDSAKRALGKQIRVNEISLTENIEKNALVPGYYMCLILLVGQDFNTSLKIFYFTSDLKPILEKRFPNDTAEGLNLKVHDLMRETLNLAGGTIKRELEKQNLTLTVSLPVVTRGFDQVFSNDKADAQTSTFFLIAEPLRMTVIVSTDIKKNEVIEKLTWEAISTQKVEGDLEFL